MTRARFEFVWRYIRKVKMYTIKDGLSSSHFQPVPFNGNVTLSALRNFGVSDEMAQAVDQAPSGQCVGWGIPFEIRTTTISFSP
jgi:hypothetical protein